MTGDADDIADRLRRYLPRWFGPGPTPVLDTLLAGLASALGAIFALYAFAKLQTRIATSTGGWLDLSAFDYFGDGFPRFSAEPDVPYGVRIRREVLRDRNTRHAIDRAVFDITGVHPHIFEGWHSPTCGGWGTPGLAFGRAGRWGSRLMPFEVLVVMPLPQGYGIPNRGGFNTIVGGWGVGNFSLVSSRDIVGNGPTVADILAAIDRVRAAGIVILVRFLNPIGTGDPEA